MDNIKEISVYRYIMLVAAAAFVAAGCGTQVEQAGDTQAPGDGTVMVASGQVLFDRHCAQCHGEQGQGLQPGQPDLRDADWHARYDDEEILQYVRNGIEGKMPPFRDVLTEEEQQAVVSYTRELAQNGN
jgi:thiosulfate dehydrogenase